jgi:hypothetical protein
MYSIIGLGQKIVTDAGGDNKFKEIAPNSGAEIMPDWATDCYSDRLCTPCGNVTLGDKGQLLDFRELIPQRRRLLKFQVFCMLMHLRFQLLESARQRCG